MGAFAISTVESEARTAALTRAWREGPFGAAERMRVSLNGGERAAIPSRPTAFERFRAEADREESFGQFVRRVGGAR